MNELIEELHNRLTQARFPMGTISIDDMTIIVETACKAQRNACAKVYNEVCLHSSIPTTTAVSLIKNAEIERCDYE